jgi:peptidoglycan hydrolase CwlO-like protein
VLNNLQLAVTKMQNNLVKLEKNIESGRKVIEEKNKEVTGTKHEILEKEILNESI